MQKLNIFWQFCRPHTIFGSVFSVSALYILAVRDKDLLLQHWYTLLLTLIASLACNLFIVGLNQIIDKELDKINKPYLPLAAGTLQVPVAKKIIALALCTAIITAFMSSYLLGFLILIICLIGYCYSVPPLQLKKHHLPAALCISLVRGLLVNIGMFVHFRYVVLGTDPTAPLPGFLICLTLFIIAFSIAIAWFKDLPDTAGDAHFRYKTMSVLYSPGIAFIAGTSLVLLAYGYCLIWSRMHHHAFLTVAHAVLAILFMLGCSTVRLAQLKTIKRFYLGFWVLFFLEYIVFAVWSLL